MQTRREVLSQATRLAALLAAGGVLPGLAAAQATAYNGAAFDAKTMAEVMKAWGAAPPVASTEVGIVAPDIAENGAAVPVVVSTTLAGARRLLLLVEKNPNTLSAMFDLNDAIDPSFSTRIKMSESCNVYAVAQTADGKSFFAHKDVKVTLGGCGG